MHDVTGDGAGVLRRAERHLQRARGAGGDADLALSAAWLASRYALLAVLAERMVAAARRRVGRDG